jgi:hypothetical protein
MGELKKNMTPFPEMNVTPVFRSASVASYETKLCSTAAVSGSVGLSSADRSSQSPKEKLK